MKEKENIKNNERSNKKIKKEKQPSMIKNKEKSSAVHAKLEHQKKVEKRKKLKACDAAEKRAHEFVSSKNDPSYYREHKAGLMMMR